MTAQTGRCSVHVSFLNSVAKKPRCRAVYGIKPTKHARPGVMPYATPSQLHTMRGAHWLHTKPPSSAWIKNSESKCFRNFLGRVDKKDATLKMAKLIIYQGITALFRLFFKVFFVLVLPLVKNKELTKKMPLFLAVFFAYTMPKNAPWHCHIVGSNPSTYSPLVFMRMVSESKRSTCSPVTSWSNSSKAA